MSAATRRGRWSSARAHYVLANDGPFQAWLADPTHRVTDIPSEAELQEVLGRLYPAGWPFVPQSVTNYQARAVLMSQPGSAAGRSLFDDVNAALQALGGTAWQAWEYANDITRDGELVAQIGTQLGLNSAQLDALFVSASQISA